MPNKGGKELILEAARAVIARHGVSNASVQSIVDEAGISKGALYYHYKGKDNILYDMIDQFLRDAIAPVKKSLYNSEDTEILKRALLESMAKRLSDIEHNKLQFYLTHEAIATNEEMHERLGSKYRDWADTSEELMKRLYNMPPTKLDRAIVTTVLAAIDGQVLQLLLGSGVVPLEDLLCLWNILIEVGIPSLLKYLNEHPEVIDHTRPLSPKK